MIVGKLFVALGIKGSKKSKSEIDGVKKSLKDTASMGLEAKAAIIGAVYALERMFAKSGQVGTDLTNFNAALGISTQTLQQYQYAARQVGVSNEAVAGSFANIQKIITDVKLNKGAPESMALLGKLTGMTQQDFFKSDFSPEILIQKLQEAALKLKDAPGLKNKLLADFGMGQDMSAALSRNAFRPEVMAKAPTYSNGEIAQLDKANVAWSNLNNKIEMAFGHFNAKHGAAMVKDIDSLVGPVIKLAEAFEKLATKVDLFKKLGMVFEGWEHIFNGITAAIEFINKQNAPELPAGSEPEAPPKHYLPGEKVPKEVLDAEIGKKIRGEMVNDILNFFQKTLGGGYGEAAPPPTSAPHQNLFQPGKVTGATVVEPPSAKKSVVAYTAPTSPVAAPSAPNLTLVPNWKPEQHAPPPGVQATSPQAVAAIPPGVKATSPQAVAAPTPPAGSVGTQNVNTTVNQSLNFTHDGKDARQTGDSVKRATQNALRQMPGLAQGS